MKKYTLQHYMAQLSGVTLIQLPFTISWLLAQPNKYVFILSSQFFDFFTNILINVFYIHLYGFLLRKKTSAKIMVMISLIIVLVSPSIFQYTTIAFKWLFMGLAFKNLGFEMIQKITPGHMAAYSLYIAIYFFTHYWLEYNEQREKALKASALANEAQLQMLQYQINPHFLFNSLNTIQSMVEIDKDRAKEMIADLSDFFRHTLSGKNQVFISLKEELDALNKYLSIQKERFKDRLKITFDIDKESLTKNIPAFLIHPLVENSIKYGFSSTNNILELVIKTELTSNELTIIVKNSGKLVEHDHLKEDKISSTKTGIENIKKRLSLLYPDNHKFELFEKDNWVTAKIIIKEL